MSGRSIIKNIFIVIMLVLIPVSMIYKLWEIITTYWMIITAILFFAVGALFWFFYFKEYSWKLVVSKVKMLINNGVNVGGMVSEKGMSDVMAKRSVFFLTAGVILELMALYLGFRYFKK